MQEKNRDTLRRALDRLPEYEPGNGLWRTLDHQLDRSDQQVALDKLPTYAPPPQVWNTLNRDLDRQRVRHLQRRRWLNLAAVAVGLLVFATLILPLIGNSGPKVTIAVTEEPASAVPVSFDWQEEDTRFEMLLSRLSAYSQPEINTLKVELEELNGARSDLEAMLDRYGNDPVLIRQLGDIERERSDIYRRLIAQL